MALISGVSFMIILVLVFTIPSYEVLGLFWPAILLGPAAVILWGLAQWRLGIALSPLLILLIPAVSLAGEYFSVWQLQLQDQTDLAAPAKPYDTVILATDYGYCSRICAQILMQTPYQVAVPIDMGNPRGRMILFRKGEGEICYGKDGAGSLLTFAEMHIAGACALERPVASPADALVFERMPIKIVLHVAFPGLVHGATFDVIERTGGEDRLLGRWIDGDVRGVLIHQVAVPFKETDIIGAALGLHFDDTGIIGKARRVEMIHWLRPALRAPRQWRLLVNHYANLLAWYAEEHSEDAEPLIQELIASDDPEQHAAGISLLPANRGSRYRLPPEEPISP